MSSNQHEIDDAFLREARIGLMVLTVLVAVFIYVAFGKLSGWNEPRPAAFQNQKKLQDDANSPSPDARMSKDSQDGSKMLRQPRQTDPANPADRQNKSTQQASRFSANPIEQNVTEVPVEPVALQPRPKSPKRRLPALNPPINRANSQLSEFIPSSLKTDPGDGPSKTLASPTSTFRDDRFQMGENRFLTDDATKPPPVIPASVVPSADKFKPGLQVAPPATGQGTDRSEESIDTEMASVQPASAVESIGQPNFTSGDDVQQIESNAGESPFSNKPSPAAKNLQDAVPLPSKNSTVIVDRGDSFWLIAQQAYGDGRYFDALYQFNKDRVDSFNDVPEGTELLIPPVLELRQRWPRLCPREQVETTGGETLFEIAGDRLGQASRYVELLKLNYSRLPQDVDQNTRLPAGIMLELPRQ